MSEQIVAELEAENAALKEQLAGIYSRHCLSPKELIELSDAVLHDLGGVPKQTASKQWLRQYFSAMVVKWRPLPPAVKGE